MIKYAVERYQDAINEMSAIYPEHWKEIALDQSEIALDPDYAKYAAMAEKGFIHLATARDDGALVGYCMFFIGPHLHYKSTIVATNDILFLKRSHRGLGTGKRFLEFSVKSLPESVKKVVIAEKLHHPFGKTLANMGMVPIEQKWSMTVRN